MSALAGIVHLDGGKADGRDLERMLRSMAHWGQQVWKVASDDACFGRVGVDVESPTVCLDGGSLIAVAARLDNRQELADCLGHRSPEQLTQSAQSDDALVGHAFAKWGTSCPSRLNGDWSFAVWQPAARKLFLARDHFGNSALYYARVGERLAFASDIKALLALAWIPRDLNELRIASVLVGGALDTPESTVYRSIFRLPPAHTLTVSDGQVRVDRYWRLEETPDAGPPDPGERTEWLRATLRAAVCSRLGDADHVGVTLSGGIDSGGVAAFAAEYLRSQGRRLTAFTAVPAFGTGAARQGAVATDEGPVAGALARAFDSVDHVLVPAKAVSPVLGVRRALAIQGEPATAAANFGWITEILAEAQTRGIRVMLTGQVGDFVMAGRPAAAAWRRDWAAGRYGRFLYRLAPEWVRRLRQSDWKPWRLAEPVWRSYSVVHPDFATETKLAERLRDLRRGPSVTARQAMSHVGAVWPSLGATYGITVMDPLQDKRVMELMFSGPRPEQAGATDRWLFRQALQGVIPEDVRLSRHKGLQSADIVERLRASWSEVDDALNTVEQSPLVRRCIDMPYFRTIAASVRVTQPAHHARGQAVTLVNGLSVALFLAETWDRPQ